MRNNIIAIDMGSVNTNIYKLGEGLVLAEASAVAITVSPKGKIKAVGDEAKQLFGKTAGTSTVLFPISEGSISDDKIATKMIETFINKITLSKFSLRPQAVVAVPCGADGEEIKKYEKVLNGAGVYGLSFVESPILTALGLNLPISESTPCFVVDLGGGTTNIAAVSLDGVISGVNVNIGGRNIDAMIIHHLEEYFAIKIGMLTAERIKMEIGSLFDDDSLRMDVSGSDIVTGKPRSVSIGTSDVIVPIRSFFDKIFEITEMLMAKLPAEVSAEVRKTGIFFAGGTSKIPGLEIYAREVLAMRSTCFDNPENATVVGGGIVAGDRDLLKKVCLHRK